MPRVAASYAAYVAAPVLMINWLASRSYTKALALVVFFGIAAGLNWGLGLLVSPTAWVLELALILPFLAASLGFIPAQYFNGRMLIRTLNIILFITSLISLTEEGFPFLLPYIHFLPDLYNGGFGDGGAKIVTVVGFFGLAEALSREERPSLWNRAVTVIAGLNFLVPNFILGIAAGAFALAIFARRNRALIFAGAAAAMVIVPYLQYRAETIDNAFSEYYGAHPKLYAFGLVGQVYYNEPHTFLVGAGIGQFSSQPALWASPINNWVNTHKPPLLPGLYASEVHSDYLAPLLMRFRDRRFAIESSANKPYSGITQLMIEVGFPLTVLILYSAHALFWRRGRTDLGRSVFLFLIAINMLDPQVDSPWFGVMLFATLEALHRDARNRLTRRRDESDNSADFLPRPPGPQARPMPAE